MRRRRLPAVAGVLLGVVLCMVVAFAGCGSDSSAATTSAEAEERSEGPKPKIPTGPTAEKLIVKDPIEGDGAAAEKGDLLAVHFVAGIYETGEEIESAWVPGNPLGFQLGGGNWGTGWEEGMGGMKVGGRRVLIYPTNPKDTPPGSKPGDTLVYVVDLVGLERPEKDGGS